MKNEYWEKFEKTGFVSDYLDYAQSKMDAVDKEGVGQNESGNSDGNGAGGNADWGIR